ncbi:hypothetical protein GbCGDNIH3_7171 [Granulibacter bethesdensis]|uniref:Uncharacterized protein n=1 Tax=Granulibacter bethesdensis TaxID=364410 RepID=A0AAN0VF81_9PROT|nr:hypothetical protein GbCGDNIH3_7171 [Granulibacter bethesdensis]
MLVSIPPDISWSIIMLAAKQSGVSAKPAVSGCKAAAFIKTQIIFYN